MSFLTHKYPLAEPLPAFERHDKLFSGSQLLGEIALPGERDERYSLVKRGNHLAYVSSFKFPKKVPTKKHYICKTRDFPLRILSWFPKALKEFQKPPADGGLPAGVIIGQDYDLDGEMVAIGATMEGYDLTNRSRSEGNDMEWYEPMCISLRYELLYDHGLLKLWTELGERYDNGEFDD